jgi:multidrug efflux pump subunit AcrB
MGGIVGRLFREFAMTVTIAVLVSMVVSLTLTPMMCSRFLSHHTGGHNLAYRVIERFMEALQNGYRRTLDIALRFQFATLMVFFATVAATAWLFITIPRAARTSPSRRCRSARSWSAPCSPPIRRSTAIPCRSAPASSARPATTPASSSR